LLMAFLNTLLPTDILASTPFFTYAKHLVQKNIKRILSE